MDLKLVMFKANGQRKDFPVVSPVTTIGRAEDCDLRIPLLSVSRRHCELTVSEDVAKIKDLGSSNGTYVNNARVNEGALKPGDRLVVGPVVFTVQIDGAPEEIHPVKTRGQKIAEGAEGQVEEVVDLEADASARPAAPPAKKTAAKPPKPGAAPKTAAIPEPAAEAAGEDDVIAALEALAAESDEDKEEKDKEG